MPHRDAVRLSWSRRLVDHDSKAALALEPAGVLDVIEMGVRQDQEGWPRPDPRYRVLTALWLHDHWMALAAKGRTEEAWHDHAELIELARSAPPELRAGNNKARNVMEVAGLVLQAHDDGLLAFKDKTSRARR